MPETLKTRIEDRNAAADEHLKEQGPLGRAGNRVGLATANATDRVASTVGGNKAAFLGGTLQGVLRGVTIGGVIWLAAFALGVIPAAAGFAAFLGIAGVSAVLGGITDGQRLLEKHAAHKHKRLADRIAEKSGAVPDKKLTEPIREEVVEKPVPSFAAREEARRRQAAAAQHHRRH